MIAVGGAHAELDTPRSPCGRTSRRSRGPCACGCRGPSRRSRTSTTTPRACQSRIALRATRRRAAAGARRRRSRRRRRASAGARCGPRRAWCPAARAVVADPVGAERERGERAAVPGDGAWSRATGTASWAGSSQHLRDPAGTGRSAPQRAAACGRSTRGSSARSWRRPCRGRSFSRCDGDDGRLVDALEAGLEHAQAVVDVLEAHPVALVVEADLLERLVADELQRGGDRAARRRRAPRAGRRARTGSGAASRGAAARGRCRRAGSGRSGRAGGRRRRRRGGPAVSVRARMRSSQPGSGNSMSALTRTASRPWRERELEADVDGRGEAGVLVVGDEGDAELLADDLEAGDELGGGAGVVDDEHVGVGGGGRSETRQRRRTSSSSSLRRNAGTTQSVGRIGSRPDVRQPPAEPLTTTGGP